MYVGKSNEIVKQGQEVIMTELGKFNGLKLKLSIRSDAYKAQCHATAHVWSTVDMKWNLVYSIPHGLMDTNEGLAYLPTKPTRVLFEKDRETLLTKVTFILG